MRAVLRRYALRRRIAKARVCGEVVRAVLVQPAGSIGALIVVTFVLAALLAPLIEPASPYATNPTEALSGPSWAHILGTDEVGRDVLSRILHGGRPTITVAVIAVLCGGTLGALLGIAGGYRRGVADALIMRASDVVFAFPLILIGICALLILGPGVVTIGAALGFGLVPMFARLARGEVLREMQRDYIRAARSMGASPRWIVTKHVVPNIASALVVQAATATSAAVLLASTLDFLGVGTQPPSPSWGNLLQAGRVHLATNPVFALSPGVVLTTFLVGINLVAAALTNALDPRIRTRVLRRSFTGRRRRDPSAAEAPRPVETTPESL